MKIQDMVASSIPTVKCFGPSGFRALLFGGRTDRVPVHRILGENAGWVAVSFSGVFPARGLSPHPLCDVSCIGQVYSLPLSHQAPWGQPLPSYWQTAILGASLVKPEKICLIGDPDSLSGNGYPSSQTSKGNLN